MSTTIDTSVLNTLNGNTAAAQARQSAELRDSFMTLLTTQLKNQNPLDPMDNAEMTSQLAQINTVSGIEELNRTLQAISTQIDARGMLQAAALIGKGVLVPGDRVLLQHDAAGVPAATPFGVELDAPAENLIVSIVDGGGQVVNRYELGAVGSGMESFTWDGMTGEGTAAAPGAYRVRVEAQRGQTTAAVATLNYAVVGGVVPVGDKGGFRLDLGAVYGQVELDAVKQIL